MKKRKITAMILITLALMVVPALAAGVSGTMRGNGIEITWQTGTGECELTVYQGDWPICVRSVRGGSGSMTVPVEAGSGSYSLRLRAPEGCYTAKVTGMDPTQAPTAEPTEQPEQQPTPKPTAVPTAAPTVLPTAEPTAVPTAVPTVLPTAEPTTVPTTVPTSKPTAKPVQTTTVPPASATNRDDLAGQVLRLVNEERASRGLDALRMDGELTRAACVRAGEIVRQFSHTRPDGSSWSSVSGSAYGENIAKGQQTPEKVIAAWMTSTSHRENILRASYGSIGICAYKVNGVMYWVQLFGK